MKIKMVKVQIKMSLDKHQ